MARDEQISGDLQRSREELMPVTRAAVNAPMSVDAMHEGGLLVFGMGLEVTDRLPNRWARLFFIPLAFPILPIETAHITTVERNALDQPND